MPKEWSKKGNCLETELARIVEDTEFQYFVAYQTDKFLAGIKQEESLKRINWSKLLEIRLFSENMELLARRTMIGPSNWFQWRIASEEGLNSDEYIEREQTLDIDANYTREGEYGCLTLMTTGGGSYELPIKEGVTAVRVISYIYYDSNDGMAHIFDNRLVGFR